MKLQRHTTSHGTMCDAAEVADLEAKCAELEASHGELLAVAKDVLGWREGVFSAIHPKASFLFDRLRSAIAKAEGHQA